MKKVLALVLVLAVTLVLAIPAAAAVPGDDAKNQVKIAKGTPVIDGVKDDCYTVADKISTPWPNAGVEGTGHATLTEGYLVYDADALYFWGHVSDPTLSANSDSWNGDGIEIFLNYELADGVGATDVDEPYGEIGCTQFRAIPIPVDGQTDKDYGGFYEWTGHGYSQELAAYMDGNPGSFFIKTDADNKGYTVEFKFPYPAPKKASVKSGLAIGFSVQINDAQDGSPTEDARRTGTIHSQDGDDFEQCWQYVGAFGRALFSDLEYVAPVEAVEEAPAAGGGSDAPEQPVVPAPAAPKTGDAGMAAVIALAVTAAAGIVILRKKAIG